MTRDDIRGIVEGITDEQLKKILDLHSSHIGKIKSGAEELRTQLDSANSRIAELETSLGEAENLRNKVNELQKSIDDRNALDADKEKQRLVEERFGNAAGNVTFINELTRQGVLSEFVSALEDSSKSHLSDAEIFTSLTEGRDNLFAPDGNIPVVVSSTPFGRGFSDSDVREIMGLPAEN